MDLNTITAVLRPGPGAPLLWQPGDAFLGGGTWLFSEPQPGLSRLIDLDALGWAALRADETGLHIGATCRIAALAALQAPSGWQAAPLIRQCCEALLGSFKIWNMATVGGNLCLGLPAGPMIALTAALDGVCTVWAAHRRDRQVAARDFVTGPQRTVLQPGEILRSIDLPAAALRRRTAFRQISLSPAGRSAALLIGTLDPSGAFALTVTAATRHPVQIAFPVPPSSDALRHALSAAIPVSLYHDDVHGHPEWRRHMTHLFADAINQELAA